MTATLLFLAGWLSAFGLPQQAPALVRFVSACLCASFAATIVAVYLHRRFHAGRIYLSPVSFGIFAGFAALVTIDFTFSVVTFLIESISHELIQWGGLYFFLVWIAIYGAFGALGLGALYGLLLKYTTRTRRTPVA
jgi:presenilin-like A22 family membrane protease